MSSASTASILKPPDNCWRMESAGRVAVAIDGAAYFRAVREALLEARQTVFILGWDIHSQLRLERDRAPDDCPEQLGPLLDYIARERGVEVYVLSWDFAMIYVLERESFPLYSLNWKTHSRVNFHMDDAHPVGASQHQKLVVVDDAIAFCGGFDLSKWRWDTPEHRVQDERRTDPDGKPYPPFHDIQMLVDGDAARALAEVARERWQRVTGRSPAAAGDSSGTDPWPPSLEPLVHNVDVAIARTLPAHRGQAEVREVERLYLDSIAAASDSIYIENQYLTSHSVGDALAARLKEANGPEVVIVLPRETGGWLEQQTMDVLRGRLVARLQEADKHGRLRIYYPRLSDSDEVALMVHAKLMIVDDWLLHLGSSNLSNRSMGLDSECDLAFETGSGAGRRQVISGLRNRLLAEHLGVQTAEVGAALDAAGGLVAAIEDLRSEGRTLQPLDTSVDPAVDRLVPEASIIDPEQPVDPQHLLSSLVEREQQPHAIRRAVVGVGMLVALLGLAAAWRWTPLGEALDLDGLAAQARTLSSHPATPLLVTLAFALAGTLAVPLTLLVLSVVVAFGALYGFFYALAGAVLSALLSYWIGRFAGRDLVRRYAGERLNSVSRQLSRRGLLATITLRVVPVAPYAVVNMVAGASHISLRDFTLGTLLGLLPGLAAIALFGEGLMQSLRDPDRGNLAWLGAGLLALAALIFWLRRQLRQRQA